MFKSKFCSRDRSALTEGTRSAIFLFQRRFWQILNIPEGYESEDHVVYESLSLFIDNKIDSWHNDANDSKELLSSFLGWSLEEYRDYADDSKNIPHHHYEDWEPKELSWEQLEEITFGEYDTPCAINSWVTERVYLTREEATRHGTNKHYNYVDGWRVYSVPAEGELVEVLKDGTEMTLKLNSKE